MKNEDCPTNKNHSYFSPRESYNYAKSQGKRIPELEPVIMKSRWVYNYAKEVVKGRWPEAESYFFKHPATANTYLREIPEARTPSKDVPLMLGNYAIIDVPNTITDEQVLNLIKIIEPNNYFPCDNVIFELFKIKRYYFEPQIKERMTYKSTVKVTTTQLLNDDKLRLGFLQSFGYFMINDFE